MIGDLPDSSSSSAPRSSIPSLTSLIMPPSLNDYSFSTQYGTTQQANISFSGQHTQGRDPRLNSSLTGTGTKNSSGFWKNPILYKTTICDNWAARRPCKYATRCWYAHGEKELRYVPRLDQLEPEVREALFVDNRLARLFFNDLSLCDNVDTLSSSSSGISSLPSSGCPSRAEVRHGDDGRHSLSPYSRGSLSSESPLSSPTYRASTKWAPGGAWVTRTPSRGSPTVSTSTPRVSDNGDYRLFSDNYPLSFDLPLTHQ